MKGFDLSPWVRSPEMRDYLQRNWTPTARERVRLILHAYRPLEERIAGLTEYANHAGPEEQKTLSYTLRTLDRVRELMEQDRPEYGYLWKVRGVFDYLDEWRYVDAGLSSTWAALMEEVRDHPRRGCDVERCVQTREGLKPILRFTLEWFGEEPRVTSFCPEDNEAFLAGVPEGERQGVENVLILLHSALCKPPEPFPFVTGDLATLDAPVFPEPVTGVIRHVPARDGKVRKAFLGYAQGSEYRFVSLHCSEINLCWGYRVMDWLRPATAAGLPAGQEALSELAAHLRTLEEPEAGYTFFHVFDDYFDKDTPFETPHPKAYRTVPATLKEVLPE